jgi:hypothetical protein
VLGGAATARIDEDRDGVPGGQRVLELGEEDVLAGLAGGAPGGGRARTRDIAELRGQGDAVQRQALHRGRAALGRVAAGQVLEAAKDRVRECVAVALERGHDAGAQDMTGRDPLRALDAPHAERVLRDDHLELEGVAQGATVLAEETGDLVCVGDPITGPAGALPGGSCSADGRVSRRASCLPVFAHAS